MNTKKVIEVSLAIACAGYSLAAACSAFLSQPHDFAGYLLAALTMGALAMWESKR